MKTTLEIPDPIFRKAKAKAAAEGISLREYITEAVKQKLREGPAGSEKPWMKSFGVLRHFHKGNVRIQKIIDEEFEHDSRPTDRYPGGRTRFCGR